MRGIQEKSRPDCSLTTNLTVRFIVCSMSRSSTSRSSVSSDSAGTSSGDISVLQQSPKKRLKSSVGSSLGKLDHDTETPVSIAPTDMEEYCFYKEGQCFPMNVQRPRMLRGRAPAVEPLTPRDATDASDDNEGQMTNSARIYDSWKQPDHDKPVATSTPVCNPRKNTRLQLKTYQPETGYDFERHGNYEGNRNFIGASGEPRATALYYAAPSKFELQNKARGSIRPSAFWSKKPGENHGCMTIVSGDGQRYFLKVPMRIFKGMYVTEESYWQQFLHFFGQGTNVNAFVPVCVILIILSLFKIFEQYII